MPVQGARISALDPAGAELASTTTNGSGTFQLEAPFPPDFRLVARPLNTQQEFSLEVRGYAGRPFWAQITVPTSLVSDYLRTHPELSLSQAESAIKAGLNIPAGLSPSIGIEESPRNPFSHIAFWRQAGQSGGYPAYRDSVLRQLGTGQDLAFVLTPEQLRSPITGLDPGLEAVAEEARTSLATYLVFSSESLAFNPAAKVMRRSEVRAKGFGPEGPSNLVGQFLLGTTTGVVGNLLTFGTKALLGWAANQMGLNYGTGGQLNEIQTTLNQVAAEAESINVTIATGSVRNQFDSLTGTGGAVSTIKTAMGSTAIANSFRDALSQVGTNITNQPFIPSIAVASTLTSLKNQTAFTAAVGNIRQNVLGAPGVPSLTQSAQTLAYGNGLGIDNPSNSLQVPWRNNNLIDQSLNIFSYLANYQAQGIYLAVENAHIYNLLTDPASLIDGVLPPLGDAAAGIKVQRGLQPLYLPSDFISVDLEAGVMWFVFVQDAATYESAEGLADALELQGILPDGSVVTYSDWRLPTVNEMQTLQYRGTYNPQSTAPPVAASPSPLPSVPVNSVGSFPNFGQATNGLPSLGFLNVAGGLDSEPDKSDGTDGQFWFTYWFTEPYNEPSEAKPQATPNNAFRLNHESSTLQTHKDTDQVAFLVCRSLGISQPPTVVLNPYVFEDGANSNSAYDSVPPAVLPSPVIPAPLLPGEYLAYGVFNAPSAPTVQAAVQPSPFLPGIGPSPPVPINVTLPVNSLQLATNLTATVTVGGRVVFGTAQGSKSFNLNQVTLPAGPPISTLDSTGRPNALSRLVAFQSENQKNLRVLNVPGFDGLAIPYAATLATINATVFGGQPNRLLTTNATFTPSNISTGNLISIQVNPRNQIYGRAGTALGTYPVYCTAFYDNWTVQNVVANYTVTPPTPGVQVISGLLQVNPSPSTPEAVLRLTANYQGQTDSALFGVVPVNALSPTPTPTPTPSPSPAASASP